LQKLVSWDPGITAKWYRANSLINLQVPSPGKVTISLVEEHTEQHWELTFHPYQAIRVTTEECIWNVGTLSGAPQKGGFFEALDSDWIKALGKGKIHFLEKSRHFIVSTYDDVIEIVAWDCSVTKLESRGY
jgi:hypothetical protein